MTVARAGRLLFDSAQTLSTQVGTRSAPAPERTLVFRSGGLVVDLVLHASGRRFDYLQGQIVRHRDSEPVSGARVRVDGVEPEATTDEHGQFAVGARARGDQQVLRVAAGADAIVCTIPPERDTSLR